MKTKKITQLLTLAFCAIAFAFVTSCEGPQGPAGLAGTDGTDGIAGSDGIDANETCKVCHNSNTEIVGAQQAQFAYGAHSAGTYYNRGGDCAGCHNNEGFSARPTYTDEWTEANLFDDALTQISCYTCHKVHETYTADDWGLSYATQVVKTYFGFESADYTQGALADNGNSNLCVQCHQSRDPGLVPLADATGTIDFTDKRWGPHHGPQGNVTESRTGIRVGTGYPTEGLGHTKGLAGVVTCTQCHMPDADHALGFADNYGTKVWNNYATCATCHTDEATAKADHAALKIEVNGKIDALKALLLAQNVIDADGYVVVPATYTADQAKALWNYKLVTEDHSVGIHAPAYVKTLLDNSITLITP